jgi:TPR repeat protein
LSLLTEGKAAFDRGDFSEALDLWLPLAERGDARAQVSVAMLYNDGKGVRQDHAEAARWFRLAAETDTTGFAAAMLADIEDTEGQRRRAYEGDAHGQYRLGMACRAGWGVPQDLVQAHLWMTLAAEQGHEEAQSLREIFARPMTPEQLGESERLARQWRKRRSPEARGDH